jgi:cell division transport system ATP-binding protein
MIRFSAVTKTFGAPSPAINNVNFLVEKGEFVFLTGASGSGKSTLLKLITKEYMPTEGDIEFDSIPLSQIRGSKIHHHRRRIGVVFQDYRLLPELNVWENIALPLEILGRPKEEIEERVTDLLELVQLSDKPYAFPNQLSGGESQRVGIARALATAPGVLLADEPTGNLDPQNTLLIAKLFHKIHQLGTTILFATHDLSILNALSARRIHLDKGQVMSDAQHTAGKNTEIETSEPPEKNKSEKKAEAKEEETVISPAPSPETSQAPATSQEPTSPEPETSVKPEETPSVAPKTESKKAFRFPKFSLPFGKKKTTLEPHQHEIPEEIRSGNEPVDAKHVNLDEEDDSDILDDQIQSLEDEMREMLINVEELDSSQSSTEKKKTKKKV